MTFTQDLPEHVKEEAVEELIDELANYLLQAPGLKPALEACELQPTTRAAGLAARAAVLVLVAHELGQTVASGESALQGAVTGPVKEDVAGDREIYEVAMIGIQEMAAKAIVAKPGSEDLRAEMLKVYGEASIALKTVDDNDK